MLSLLSLIIASGTVLRADTELWEPLTYPDPRTNSTQCNIADESTLCDPDHILTDTWRQTILENVNKQSQILSSAKIPYAENASEECHTNETEGVQIYVILARRILTASNQSITSNDLTNFGHGLRDAYGLDQQLCKNYILILGVELAKEIYVWTGSDLAIPKEQMDISLGQYKNLFIERNYMEGLNKIVDEIGSLVLDPFKDITTEAPASTEETTTIEETTIESSTMTANRVQTNIPIWMYIVLIFCVGVTMVAVGLLVFFVFKRNGTNIVQAAGNGDNGKQPPRMLPELENGTIRRPLTYITHYGPAENINDMCSEPREIDTRSTTTEGSAAPDAVSQCRSPRGETRAAQNTVTIPAVSQEQSNLDDFNPNSLPKAPNVSRAVSCSNSSASDTTRSPSSSSNSSESSTSSEHSTTSTHKASDCSLPMPTPPLHPAPVLTDRFSKSVRISPVELSTDDFVVHRNNSSANINRISTSSQHFASY